MKLTLSLLRISSSVLVVLLAVCQARAADTPAGKFQQIPSVEQTPEGLSQSDWASIRAAHAAWEHGFAPIEDGWQARNPGQHLHTVMDERGFATTALGEAWQWGLELAGYGWAGRELPPCGPRVTAEGQRLTRRWDGGLEEWYVNDGAGIEHGFTVSTRPAGSGGGVLCFVMAVRGGLRPEIAPDGQAVSFHKPDGGAALTYAGLKVWDANGQILPARMTAVPGGALRIEVAEAGARYPVTVDPTIQQAYLKADTLTEGDVFGYSVAVSGDTVVVGAPYEDSSTTGVNRTPDELASNAGAAYVFVRSGTGWTQQAYLKAHQVTYGDQFGSSVAVSGDTVVVGAPNEASSTTGVDSTPNEARGFSGASYVFVRSGTTWSQQAYLKASNTGHSHYFGGSVSVSGDTVVVGARGENSSTSGVNSTPNTSAGQVGAAYVFVRSVTTWSQQAYLKAHQVNANDEFGYAVAVSGDTVVVGAHYEASSTTGVNSTPNELASRAGAAYVFVRSGTTWSQQAYLKASNTSGSDEFGRSVAVSGDTVVVGAHCEGSSTTGVNSTPNDNGDYFNAGAAYVFVRSGTTWSQQAYLKASNTGANDEFGYAVAVSGDTVVVGARYEDSSSTGVNSTPDESAGAAGAAYVFVRSGTSWTQQAYLKAHETNGWSGWDFADHFGCSVAVSSGTVVVGAWQEDSSTTGVNSTPNNSAKDAGAAYIFITNASPKFALSGNGNSMNNGDTGVSVANNTDFGGVSVSSGTAARTFTITNAGTSALTLTGSAPNYVTLSGSSAFTVTTQPASATVMANGGTQSFVITFDPSAAGVHTATVSIANDDSDATPFTFAINGVGLTAQEGWRQAYFSTAGNSGNAADNFDFDKDGLVNLLEWACNLDPTSGSVLPATLVRNGANLEYTYTRSVAALNAGATFTVEWNDTLLGPSPWSSSGATQQILSDNGTEQVVKVTIPSGGHSQCFVRLKVTSP